MTKGHFKTGDFPTKDENIMFKSDAETNKIDKSHLSSLLSCVVSWEVVYLLVLVNECAGTSQGLNLDLLMKGMAVEKDTVMQGWKGTLLGAGQLILLHP